MEHDDEEKPWDLEERSARFAEDVIDFLKKIPSEPLTN